MQQQHDTASALIQMVPMLAIMGGVFWFFIIQPQRKRMKDQDSMLSSLKKGDRVLTQAGFYAEVLSVEDKGSVICKVGEGRVEFQRQAIVSVVKPKEA